MEMTHEFQPIPDRRFPHLVYGRCSDCDWHTAGATNPIISERMHQLDHAGIRFAEDAEQAKWDAYMVGGAR